jgi:hypothetical protein
MKLVWSGKPRETKGPPAFQVDMRSCEDVAAWAALRGVQHHHSITPHPAAFPRTARPAAQDILRCDERESEMKQRCNG